MTIKELTASTDLQLVLNKTKVVIMKEVDRLLTEPYIEAKELKDLSTIVTSIQSSLQTNEPENQLKDLLAKYSSPNANHHANNADEDI